MTCLVVLVGRVARRVDVDLGDRELGLGARVNSTLGDVHRGDPRRDDVALLGVALVVLAVDEVGLDRLGRRTWSRQR